MSVCLLSEFLAERLHYILASLELQPDILHCNNAWTNMIYFFLILNIFVEWFDLGSYVDISVGMSRNIASVKLLSIVFSDQIERSSETPLFVCVPRAIWVHAKGICVQGIPIKTNLLGLFFAKHPKKFFGAKNDFFFRFQILLF